MRLERSIELVFDNAGLNPYPPAHWVDFQNLVHVPRKINHDPIGQGLSISAFPRATARLVSGCFPNPMTHPAEIDIGWAVSRTKPFFVGRRSVDILEAQPLKRKLVGFTLPKNGPQPLEGHLVLNGPDISGSVTSCEYSATLGKIIGLAYAGIDQSKPGKRIPIRVEGGIVVQAEVVQLPFFDPDNQRQEL